MEDIAYLDVDDVWRGLGRGGRYQMTQCLILMLAGTPMTFHLLSVLFIGTDINHVCNYPGGRGYEWSNKSINATPANLLLTPSGCSITINDTDDARMIEEPCSHGYNYSQPRDRSFVSEWDLVCDKEPLGKLSQTLVMAGMMVGASVLPQFGDKYGRKTLHVLCHVLMFITALIMAFNTNFYGFLFLRFVVGVTQQGFLIPLVIHILELFPANLRELIGLLINALWSVSIIITTLIGYVARNYSWRTMQIIFSVISVFSFIEFWLINSMTYFGLTLLSSKLAGNVYVNFLLGGLLEIPADILILILLKKIGRKKTVIFFHIIVGVSLLVAVLVSALAVDWPAAGTCLTMFSLAGRFAITGSFNTLWIYAPEIFPTNIRNVGVGLSSTAARIGGMASPFFNSLASIVVWGPGAIFCGLSLLIPFLITFLPETTGRELPQTLEELEEWKIRDPKKKRKDNSETTEFKFEKI